MILRSMVAVLAVTAMAFASGCCVTPCQSGCGFPDGLNGGECGVECAAPVASSCGCGSCGSPHAGATYGGCWSPGADLIRGIDRLLGGCCNGCGELYWSEFHNDPPDTCDPCDCHGNWTGRAGPVYQQPYAPFEEGTTTKPVQARGGQPSIRGGVAPANCSRENRSAGVLLKVSASLSRKRRERSADRKTNPSPGVATQCHLF